MPSTISDGVGVQPSARRYSSNSSAVGLCCQTATAVNFPSQVMNSARKFCWSGKGRIISWLNSSCCTSSIMFNGKFWLSRKRSAFSKYLVWRTAVTSSANSGEISAIRLAPAFFKLKVVHRAILEYAQNRKPGLSCLTRNYQTSARN